MTRFTSDDGSPVKVSEITVEWGKVTIWLASGHFLHIDGDWKVHAGTGMAPRPTSQQKDWAMVGHD